MKKLNDHPNLQGSSPGHCKCISKNLRAIQSCWKTCVCHSALTDEDRHWLTAGADTGAGHRCHLHLVQHAGHQAFQHRGQRVPVHRLVDVVARVVVAAAAHTPNLERMHRVGIWFVMQIISVHWLLWDTLRYSVLHSRECIFTHWWNS